jgi:hypothetical protein
MVVLAFAIVKLPIAYEIFGNFFLKAPNFRNLLTPDCFDIPDILEPPETGDFGVDSPLFCPGRFYFIERPLG